MKNIVFSTIFLISLCHVKCGYEGKNSENENGDQTQNSSEENLSQWIKNKIFVGKVAPFSCEDVGGEGCDQAGFFKFGVDTVDFTFPGEDTKYRKKYSIQGNQVNIIDSMYIITVSDNREYILLNEIKYYLEKNI
ncbi:MAG: hypothetical protein AB8C84_01475 [Oligoflexales bacterium]